MTRGIQPWRRSSFCADANCVEVLEGKDCVYVRGTGDQTVLAFSYPEWREFAEGIKAGEFDFPSRP